MAVIPGRGAQAVLSGSAQLAARGAYGTTLDANTAQRDALIAAGTAPSGATVDGTTSSGTVPVQTFDMPVAFSVADTVTAKASGNHATGTPLTAQVNRLSITAADADSVILPPMGAGQLVVVVNSGSKSAQVFAPGTGTINAVATDTGVALAAGKTGVYVAVTASTIFGGALA